MQFQGSTAPAAEDDGAEGTSVDNTKEVPDDDELLEEESEEAHISNQPSEDSAEPVDDAEKTSEIEGKGRY